MVNSAVFELLYRPNFSLDTVLILLLVPVEGLKEVDDVGDYLIIILVMENFQGEFLERIEITIVKVQS